MHSRLLLVALFAVLSAVSSRPLPHMRHAFSHSPSGATPDDGCGDESYTPSPTLSYPSQTTDDAGPTPSVPSSLPPSVTPTIPVPTSLAATPTSTPPAPTSPAPSPSLPSTSAAQPSSTPVSSVEESSNGPFTGGVATFYYQNGNAGACGQVNSDSALICAMDQTRFGTAGPSSPLCGQQVQITNDNTGQTVTVTIADDCPTCDNENSIDLSVGAFNILSDDDLGLGEIPITWSFV